MGNKIDDGGPAFPCYEKNDDGECIFNSIGMSLRDWLAGHGLPACVSRCHPSERFDDETFAQMFARKAYELADAMLAERQKGK